MFPSLAIYDVGDECVRDAINTRKARLCATDGLFGRYLADSSHVLLGQNVLRITLPLEDFICGTPSLNHVCGVVGVSPYVEVRRIEAWRVVAMVKRKKGRVEIKVKPEPRGDAVDVQIPKRRPRTRLTVSLSNSRFRPEPAIANELTILKKACLYLRAHFQTDSLAHIWRHCIRMAV